MRKLSNKTCLNALAILNLGFSLAHAIAKNVYSAAFHFTIGVLMVLLGGREETK